MDLSFYYFFEYTLHADSANRNLTRNVLLLVKC